MYLCVCVCVCTYTEFTLNANKTDNVGDIVLRLRKLRLMTAILLNYIWCKDEKIPAVAEAKTK